MSDRRIQSGTGRDYPTSECKLVAQKEPQVIEAILKGVNTEETARKYLGGVNWAEQEGLEIPPATKQAILDRVRELSD